MPPSLASLFLDASSHSRYMTELTGSRINRSQFEKSGEKSVTNHDFHDSTIFLPLQNFENFFHTENYNINTRESGFI